VLRKLIDWYREWQRRRQLEREIDDIVYRWRNRLPQKWRDDDSETD